MNLTIREFASRLKRHKESGEGWKACCPAHKDSSPSLSISAGKNGRILVKCFAGCTTENIVSAMGLKMSDLMPNGENGTAKPPAPKSSKSGAKFPTLDAIKNYYIQKIRSDCNSEAVLTVHDYNDTYKRLRFDWPGDKTCRDVSFDGQSWIGKKPETVHNLYRVGELPADGVVFVCEGEKATDAGHRIGLPCVTSGGCTSADSADWTPLAGRHVAILRDNDEAGTKYAFAVLCKLETLTPPATVRVVDLPNLDPSGDLYDFIQKRDSRESSEIRALVQSLADDAFKLPNKAQESTSAPSFKSIRELIQEFPRLRAPIIHGLLRSGETMNIIAPQKRGKSWFAVDLALAVATGKPWLESYHTECGDVLLIDNELHGETLAGRVPKIAEARGLTIEQYGDKVFVDVMRGRLTDLHRMEQGYFSTIKPRRFKLIILDSFYRFLPDGVSENDNATIANCYNIIDRLALKLGCSFVLIHHSSKGNQSGKSVVDVGSGAGAQSRATDSHLVLRQHTEPDAVVLEAAVRSWKPIEPVALRWEFPVWNPDNTLDPADLKPEYSRAKKRKPAEQNPDPIVADEVADFAERFVTANPQTKAAIVDAAVLAGVKQTRASNLLKRALGRGTVHQWHNGHKQPLTYSTERQPELADVA